VAAFRLFRFVGLILVVSFLSGVAVVYTNEKVGAIAGLGVGVLLAFPFAWVIARLVRSYRVSS
jgi:hypothetical protein